MDDYKWKMFMQNSRRIFGQGAWNAHLSQSWCAFTKFSSLENSVHYWCCGFPNEDECLDDRTVDGGLWRQSFEYRDLAHVVIPRSFYWETSNKDEFQSGRKNQDIDVLSLTLNKLEISHRKTNLILEIKLY